MHVQRTRLRSMYTTRPRKCATDRYDPVYVFFWFLKSCMLTPIYGICGKVYSIRLTYGDGLLPTKK